MACSANHSEHHDDGHDDNDDDGHDDNDDDGHDDNFALKVKAPATGASTDRQAS